MKTASDPTMQEYVHQEDRSVYEHQGYSQSHSFDGTKKTDRGYAYVTSSHIEKLVPFRSREVLTVQVTKKEKAGKTTNYILVPGYIISREGNVSKVEPITDEKARKELSDLVSQDFKGHPNFW
ncbi:MAG: hypothetical protein WC595_04235 [Candidatus Nanoarchaeia archaeon]